MRQTGTRVLQRARGAIERERKGRQGVKRKVEEITEAVLKPWPSTEAAQAASEQRPRKGGLAAKLWFFVQGHHDFCAELWLGKSLW